MAAKTEPTGPTGGNATFKAVTIRPAWALLAILMVIAAGIVTTLQDPDPQPNKHRDDRTFLEWLWYPVERHPGLRLPRPPNDLRGMAFARDGRQGLVVGAGGTILATSDGGITWNAQDSGASNSLKGVHFDPAGKQAWAVGGGGIVLATSDGGKHWASQPSGTKVRLNAVQFRDGGQQGWAVGDDSTIIATSDGGRTWQRQMPFDSVGQAQLALPPANQAKAPPVFSKQMPAPADRRAPTQTASERPNLLALHVDAGGKRGWAVGFGGVVLMTADGGATWIEQRPSSDNSLVSVKFAADGQHGWAAGFNTLLSTSDGGSSWTALPVPKFDTKDPPWLSAMDFNQDGRRGWVVRNDGDIFGTVDGGATWTRHNSGGRGWFSALRFDAQGRHGWAIGSSGTILTSEDGGRNWVTRTSSSASMLRAVHLDATGRRGWAVGATGVILATTDGGRNWEAQTGDADWVLNDLQFLADNQHGWAVGDGGLIVATSNGGKSWAVRNSGADSGLSAVHFLADGQRGWAVGEGGFVLSTNNGGVDWHSLELPGGPDLSSVHFEPGGQLGWTVGSEGKLFASKNRGRTWQRIDLATSELLFDVALDGAGQWGLLVGAAGTLFATEDGGESWAKMDSGTVADLNTIRLGKDGQTAWIAGSGGIILVTNDRGKTWSRAESKVGSGLVGLAFADDGRTGWAVGYPPALLKTEDAGKSWEPIKWPLSNQRFPAPWFWLMLLPAAFFLRLSVRMDRASAAKGVEAIAASDAPIGDFARDRLQFGPLARGISRFLRNTNTQPPLTLAISGDWGSGKSTLMELVCTDLRRYGTRPIWFNAWHHQKEEQLLAALLKAIQSKGLPPLGSADGLAFRLRLLVIRSKKHFAITCLALVAAAAFIGYLLSHGFAEWTILWNDINNAVAAMSGAKGAAADAKPNMAWNDAAHLLPQLVTGATALFSLYRALKAFNIDPAVLLSSAAENFRLKDAAAQTSFRSRFAEQFDEVTRALPYTMVIVIDDLDRCQPKTVLTVMEAVNFLVSSGKCFVMFGMATHRVQAALSLSFAKVAGELAPLDVAPAETASDDAKKQAERERRLAYARDYLEKLINLEVVVPTRTDIPPHLLVDATGAVAPNALSGAIARFAEFWPAWLASAALLAGFVAGFVYTIPHDAPPEVTIAKAAVVDPTSLPTVPQPGGPPDTTQAVVGAPLLDASRFVPEMQKSAPVVVDRWAASAALLLFIAAAGGLVLYRLRAASHAVKDSQSYHDALRIWMPVVQRHRGTPRAIKRFGNRLRYLAMLQHDTKYDETGFDELRRRLAALAGRLWQGGKGDSPPAAPAAAAASTVVDEPLLVAFACLQEVYGVRWEARVRSEFAEDGELEAAIRTAIATSRAGAAWPPDSRTVGVFEQLLKGIRISDAT